MSHAPADEKAFIKYFGDAPEFPPGINPPQAIKKRAPSDGNGVFVFDIRWTLPPRPAGGYNYGDYVTQFKEWLTDIASDHYIFQFECRNPETGVNTHIQCYAHTTVKDRPNTVRRKLIEFVNTYQPEPCFHVAHCSTAGQAALKKYAMKHDTRVDGPYADHYIYDGQDLPNINQLHPWQSHIYSEGKLPPSKENREINWVFDDAGNSGKTAICKLMAFRLDVPCITFATSRHMMDVISANRFKAMYTFDLTRTKPAEVKMDDLYSVLEQLKNGHLTKTMGGSQQWMQMPARVWVFSNYQPDLSKLSSDRFVVWKISAGQMFVTHHAKDA